ncbi:MAG: hypothetical protein JKY18_00445 [Flavobacteriales bacterium]|nr:hypothetical protein [Flavobacteriales bacterium]
MKLHKCKAILNRTIGCLFVLIMMGVFNTSVAQNKQIQNKQIQNKQIQGNQIQSNEKKVVECTPIKTKRDVAIERQQTGELQKAETKGQSDTKSADEVGKDYSKYVVKREFLSSSKTIEDKAKLEKKAHVIDDK